MQIKLNWLYSKNTVQIFLGCVFFMLHILVLAGSPKSGGQLVNTLLTDPKTFNDLMAKDSSSNQLISLMFEGLVTTDGITLEVKPHLAERWEHSDDGLIWTFYLRKDVQWFDGKMLTADDVIFTFNDLIFNEDIPSSARDVYTIEGKTFEVKKIDDYTIQFILPVKFAPFLRSMSSAILPEHILKPYVENKTFNTYWGIDALPEELIGTGPYQMTRYDPGQRIVFKRNPYYWKKDNHGNNLPYIDEIVFLILQNEDVELLKFIEGTTDVYGLRGMDYSLLKPLEQDRNFTIYDLGPSMGSNFIFFNQNKDINPETKNPYVAPHKLRWFTNLDFRRAVAHAIDKDKMISIVKNGLGAKQFSDISPAVVAFYNPKVHKYAYDLSKARQILKEAGFIDRDNDGVIEDDQGVPVEFNLYTNAGNTERATIASIIRQDLEELGMNVNFQVLEFNTFISKLTSTYEWDAGVLGLGGVIDPHFGQNVWHSSGQLHMWYPRQKEPATEWEARIDQIFSEAVQELDPVKRKKLYDEFQMIVSEQLPLIFTITNRKIVAVRNKFGNLNPQNIGGVFHNLEEIYIEE